jgi:glutamate-1-semialdehyde 2,1-aminomutase
MNTTITTSLYALCAAAVLASLRPLDARLALSRAKHPSLSGHARLARRLARLVPYYEFDDDRFFSSDDAPAQIVARRRAGFARLAAHYRERYPATCRLAEEVMDDLPDLQFTSAYRVPFQYSRYLRQHLKTGGFVASSSGVMLTDLDGNRFYDLGG